MPPGNDAHGTAGGRGRRHKERRATRRADGARHSGRRPGDADTRGAILAAARDEFARGGYDGATIRGIAAGAGVDPALVHHYFGTKDDLFEAAIELPIPPATVLPQVLASAARDQVGAIVVRQFVAVWEDADNRPVFMAMLRSVVGNEQAATLVRDRLMRRVFGPIAEILGVPDAELRANLIGSQLIGMALARYVGRVEPIASAPPDALVAALGPTIQRYLFGDLTA
jgi:AcrR family transcriptional regulator